MALVKCEKCGHMLSDKAEVCPKCGCALVKKPSSCETSNKKKRKSNAILILSLLALIVLSVLLFYFYGGYDKGESVMAAPELKTDANGFVTLEQCPTEHLDFRIELEGEHHIEKAKVYKNNILLQVLEGEEEDDVLATDIVDIRAPQNVHFVDINYDGYVDLFIGSSEERTKNSVFIWGPTSSTFRHVAKDEMFQNIVLDPSTKTLYQGGSSSWCLWGMTKYKWTQNSLEELETLYVVRDESQYENNGVTHEFTIMDSKEEILSETDDVSELPEKWRILYEKFMETTE